MSVSINFVEVNGYLKRTHRRWPNDYGDRRFGCRWLVHALLQPRRSFDDDLGRSDVVRFRADATIGFGSEDLRLLVDDGDSRVLVQLRALVATCNAFLQALQSLVHHVAVDLHLGQLVMKQFRRMTSWSFLAAFTWAWTWRVIASICFRYSCPWPSIASGLMVDFWGIDKVDRSRSVARDISGHGCGLRRRRNQNEQPHDSKHPKHGGPHGHQRQLLIIMRRLKKSAKTDEIYCPAKRRVNLAGK